MSSHSPNAAPAAVIANCAPLPEPCAVFVPPAVQAFLRRGDRMANVTAPWTVWNDASALREVELPALADPTLEAVEEPTKAIAAPATPPQSVIDELLFAPIDASTLDPSQVGDGCAFHADAAETGSAETAATEAMDWSGSACAASMATRAPMTAEAVTAEAAMDWSGGSCAPCADTTAPTSMPLSADDAQQDWSEPTCPTCMATTTEVVEATATDDDDAVWLELDDDEEFAGTSTAVVTEETPANRDHVQVDEAMTTAADAVADDVTTESADGQVAETTAAAAQAVDESTTTTSEATQVDDVAVPAADAVADNVTTERADGQVAEPTAAAALAVDESATTTSEATQVDDVAVPAADAVADDVTTELADVQNAETTAAAALAVDESTTTTSEAAQVNEELAPVASDAEGELLDAILGGDALATPSDDAPAFAHTEDAASESAWANDTEPARPFVDTPRGDDAAEAASLEEIPAWSPSSDDGAAVAVAEPEVAVAVAAAEVAVAESVAAVAATEAVVEQAAGASEPPAAPPVVVTQASRSSADADLEQMQHHVLPALEQVQANLTAALDQLRVVTPPDVSPALAELRAELTRQGEMLSSNVDAVKQLGAQVTQLDASVQQAAAAKPATPAPAATPVPHFELAAEPTSWVAPLATAALGATWSVLLWWKTGSTALAAGMLVAANLVAALQLTRTRD